MEKKCYRCDRTNHLKKECRAKTKANGEKIVDKVERKPKDVGKKGEKKNKWGKVRKQADVTDDEEENEEEDFLEEGEDSDEEK